MEWSTAEGDSKVIITIDDKKSGHSTSFGIDKEIYKKYFSSVIKPAIVKDAWNLDAVFEVLNEYLKNQKIYHSLLALMVGRVHLPDQIIEIDPRLSSLVINYIKYLDSALDSHEEPVVSAWCYNLVNALFLAARDVGGIKKWVEVNKEKLDRSFVDGLAPLANKQPRIADYCALLLDLAFQNQKL